MKRIFAYIPNVYNRVKLYTLAVVAVVCFLSASASAVTIYSYNPSYGKPVKVISVWYHGFNMVRTVTVTKPNGCKVTTTTYYAFFVPTRETVEEVCR